MINNFHSVDIIVNGEQVDIYSQEKLNLRINNVVYDPVSINSRTGEYSFSFELPATARNNRIFNYANNSAKLNKFNTKYGCEVIADGMNIFSGVLRLTDTQTSNYKCNLVNVKIYNVNDIFGDMVMSDLDWKVDFGGTPTINGVNGWYDSGYYFPLACYGAFQKDPKATYNYEINEYTDLLQIDKFNRWYWESFHPSLSLLETVKRLFAQRGYNVSGDIFNDKIMKMVYMSEYIDSSQDPAYNLNKSEIGDLHIAGFYTNGKVLNGGTHFGDRTKNGTRTPYGTFQDLTFPRELIHDDTYQWERIMVYDIFATPTSYGTIHTFTVPPTNDYLYRKNAPGNSSGFICIPSTGLYTIELSVSNVSIANASDQMTYEEKYYDSGEIRTRRTGIEKNFEDMPVEIHLVRNSNETELIGDIDEANGLMYPHEMDYTKYKTATQTNRTSQTRASTNGNFGGAMNKNTYTVPDEVYFTRKKSTIAYDPFASPNFICGFTTMNESCAVIKNGLSWNASVTEFNQSHYRGNGYVCRTSDGTEKPSQYNQNSLNCPNTDYFSTTGTYTRNGKITCVVELKKNDILFLELVTRVYDSIQIPSPRGGTFGYSQGTYDVSLNYDIKITPYTDKTDRYINTMDMYYLPSQEVKDNGWGEKLQLGNFLNNKEKAADFINNFIKTFNLEYIQDGNSVILNKSKKVNIPLNFIDLDNRVNTDNITFQRIDYPSTMQVKWAIDEEEAGAYRSIPTVQQQGAANWKEYIDRGSDKIVMDTNNENTDSSVESKFSYTWYEDFTYIDFNRTTLEDNGHTAHMRLPLISKDENFIVQNDDAMKHDGLSLKQRLWFRDQPTQETFQMWNGEEVEICVPTNTYWGYTMNFKKEKDTMLDRYYNIIPATDSNYAMVECYITPFEYIQLKNGAMAKIDNDLYVVSEIQGFDPTGNNLTTLKLIKIVN